MHLAAVHDRRPTEGRGRLSSQVESMRSRVNDTAEEIERLTAALEEAAEPRRPSRPARGRGGAAGRTRRRIRRSATSRPRGLVLPASGCRSWWPPSGPRSGRSLLEGPDDALSMGLQRMDGAATLLESSGSTDCSGGRRALTVEPGAEPRWPRRSVCRRRGRGARSRRCGAGPGAVAGGEDRSGWHRGRGRPGEAGRTTAAARDGPVGGRPGVGAGGTAVMVTRILDRVAVVETLSEAQQLVQQHPEVRAVTTSGELLGQHQRRGGRPRGRIEVQARSTKPSGARRCPAAVGQHRPLGNLPRRRPARRCGPCRSSQRGQGAAGAQQ